MPAPSDRTFSVRQDFNKKDKRILRVGMLLKTYERIMV